MFHSKSCRCELCSPVSLTCRPQECSHNWKNRFCKLRKQWSDHSKCGSSKQHPEDCTDCRSPSDEAVGKFGIAWVAEIPNCISQEPKGWQVEIIDTPEGIFRKCRQLMKWLNNPPSHLYDSIEGNEFSSNPCFQQCQLNGFKDRYEDSSLINNDKPFHYCEERLDAFSKNLTNVNCMNKFQRECPVDTKKSQTYLKECSPKDEREYYTNSDLGPKKFLESNLVNNNHEKRCTIKCKDAHLANGSVQYTNEKNTTDVTINEQCIKKRPLSQGSKKSCFAYCRTPDESSCDEFNSRPSSRQGAKCYSLPSTTSDGSEIFRKQNCCCYCQGRFYKHAGTNYEIDILPQRDLHETTTEIEEVDSKVVCAGIRSSKICRKLKEEKRNRNVEKHEKELHETVLSSRSESAVEEEIPTNQPVNVSLTEQTIIAPAQRRSSKFRRKESI